jgi:hypothetical protein
MIAMASNGHLGGTVLSRPPRSLASHALFYANTTTDAKELGDEGDLV